MYIKPNMSAIVYDMRDFAKRDEMPKLVKDLQDSENYYVKDEIDDLINDIVVGEIELKHYVMDKELARYLENHVTDIEIQYYLSDSRTETTGGEWTEVPPEWTNEKYMWQRLIISYPGIDDYASAQGIYIPNENGVCIAGAKGDTGEKGQSLIDISPQWCSYGDGMNPPPEDYGWQDIMPEIEDGMFIWSRFKLVWEYPDETNYTNPVLDQVLERIKRNIFFTDELNAALEAFRQEVSDNYQTIENSYTKDETMEELQKVRDEASEALQEAKDEIAETYITKEDSETNIADAIMTSENKVMNTGYFNLVKNGNFSNKLKNWTVLSGGDIETLLQEQVDYPSGRAVVITGELNIPNKGIQQIVIPDTKKAGTTFTMSCMMNVNVGNDGEEFAYRLYIEVYNMDKTIEQYEVSPEMFNQWVKLQKTFTVNKDIDYIELHIDLKNTNRTLKVSEIMLGYGELALNYMPNITETTEEIPTKVSQLENDKDYITLNELDLSGYALIEDIPIKLSELEQDMDYLTEHQDISHLALQSEVDDLKAEISDLQTQINDLLAIIDKLAEKVDGEHPSVTVATTDTSRIDYCRTADSEATALNKKRKDK